MKDYAKGGQVIAYKKDAPKFKKIDVTDKYVIEAINEIGLQDVKFDKSSIDDKINSEFEKLLYNTSEYIISEDSNAITNAIENDIQARYNQGDTEDNINFYKDILKNSSLRESQYINKYAETQNKGKTGSTEHRSGRKTQDDYIQTTTNYPRSILKFNNEGKTSHPTQKPSDLITYLIKTFSNENDVVLDSCMGSGTTAISCIKTNRNYIGFELNND